MMTPLRTIGKIGKIHEEKTTFIEFDSDVIEKNPQRKLLATASEITKAVVKDII
jgi:hypothetical protein